MKQFKNPIGTLGYFLPEEQDLAWGEYVNKHCKIVEATFFKNDIIELEVEFLHDGQQLTISGEEFVEY